MCPGETCTCQNASRVLTLLRALQGTSICWTLAEHLLWAKPRAAPGDPELKARPPAFEDVPFRGREGGDREGPKQLLCRSRLPGQPGPAAAKVLARVWRGRLPAPGRLTGPLRQGQV